MLHIQISTVFMIQMEEFNLPGLKNQIECRSLQQKAQEKMFKTKKLLEDNEKHLEALQDCQSKLRIEEQQVQGHIDEMIMKINTLTDEREAVNEQKVCCISNLCWITNSLVVETKNSIVPVPNPNTEHKFELIIYHHLFSQLVFQISIFYVIYQVPWSSHWLLSITFPTKILYVFFTSLVWVIYAAVVNLCF